MTSPVSTPVTSDAAQQSSAASSRAHIFRNVPGLFLAGLVAMGANALHAYPGLSIISPMLIAILLGIPRPERFAIHKLIVSSRRKEGPESLKSRKDLLQAELLIDILSEDRPTDLADAYSDAMSRGPRWREHIERSLARSPASKEKIDASIAG